MPSAGVLGPRWGNWPIALRNGPPGIKTENALLAAYVFVDIRDRDVVPKDAQQAVADKVSFPPGYYATWSGQFEVTWSAPKADVAGRTADAGDHLRAAVSQLPASGRNTDRHAVGAFRAGGRNLADVVAGLQHVVAVAVGFIALAGVAAETGW